MRAIDKFVLISYGSACLTSSFLVHLYDPEAPYRAHLVWNQFSDQSLGMKLIGSMMITMIDAFLSIVEGPRVHLFWIGYVFFCTCFLAYLCIMMPMWWLAEHLLGVPRPVNDEAMPQIKKTG